jgi:hypothetical protein
LYYNNISNNIISLSLYLAQPLTTGKHALSWPNKRFRLAVPKGAMDANCSMASYMHSKHCR